MILPSLNARTVLFAVLCFCMFSASANWYSVNGQGATIAAPAVESTAKTKSFDLLKVDAVQLELQLATVVTGHPWEALNSSTLLTVPMPGNESATFRVVETPIMASQLAQRFPSIKTYYGVSTDDPSMRIRFDQTPAGFHAMITGDEDGTVIIDPWSAGETEIHMIYRRSSQARNQNFECHNAEEGGVSSSAMRLAGDCQLRQYRLAVSATGEFTAFHGGTVVNGLAAVVTIINRVNEVYERDFGVTLQLVANNDLLIFTNAATDPFTNSSVGTMLGENISTCSSVIGNGNFDVGHVFGTSGGGVAYGGVVCNNSFKAGGVTGVSPPLGDVFAIDYASHELGHQFACGHTQNNSCNRSLSSSYEPGSASTILGYAGICSPNVQPNSDAMMHGISIEQATNHILGSGGSCATIISSSNNNAPSVSGGSDYTIPKSTPFRLTATGSDLDGDALTYSWEGWDATPATMPPVGASTDGPNFRTNLPTSSPTRYFPNLPDLALGIAPTWEVLSDVARSLPFRVTVRDNHPGHGCTDEDDVNLTVSGSAGPVLVTAPVAGTTWFGGTVATVSWDVAGTNIAPVNCNTVNILLSTDLGNTYPFVLASGVPNNGTASVTVPALTSSSAKIMVEGADNPMFQVSNGFFTIDQTVSSCASLDAPINLISTVNPSNVTLSWDVVSGATAYRVTGGPLGGGTGNSPPIIGETNTSWSIPSSALNLGVTYEWQVRAACGPLPTATPVTPLSVADQFTMPTLKLNGGITSLYPNPADRSVYVGSSTGSAAQLSVYNASGQLVLEERIAASGSIDVSQWDQGLYRFRIFTEDRYEVHTVSVIH